MSGCTENPKNATKKNKNEERKAHRKKNRIDEFFTRFMTRRSSKTEKREKTKLEERDAPSMKKKRKAPSAKNKNRIDERVKKLQIY